MNEWHRLDVGVAGPTHAQVVSPAFVTVRSLGNSSVPDSRGSSATVIWLPARAGDPGFPL